MSDLCSIFAGREEYCVEYPKMNNERLWGNSVELMGEWEMI